jgi:RNA polymerase sigma factor (sigma-70 family)
MAGGEVHEHLATLFGVGAQGGLADGELLGRFLHGDAARAEAAMAALVERHGPMVMRVCRRVLRDEEAARDAFQATFLVLVRRAGSIRRAEGLGGWLHGVALRVARKARAAADRRREHERRGAGAEAVWPAEEPCWMELHEEVDRLPARYREAIVLCYLRGMTTEAAADRLGCPQGTVLSRLSRGRDRLRARLARRGYGAGAVAALADAGVPPALASGLAGSTARIATLFATGSTASGAVGAVALARGVLRAMLLNRMGGIGLGLVVVGAVGLGAGRMVVASLEAGPAAVAEPLAAPAVPPPTADPAQFGAGGGEPTSFAHLYKGPGKRIALMLGDLIVLQSEDQRRCTVYDGATGESATVEVPEGVTFVPMVHTEVVALALRGEAISRLAVYSTHTEGGWSTQDLPEPVAGPIDPHVAANMAMFRVGKRVYAFSTLTSGWAELELTGSKGESMRTLPQGICVIEDGPKLFAFSAKTGQWAEIKMGE